MSRYFVSTGLPRDSPVSMDLWFFCDSICFDAAFVAGAIGITIADQSSILRMASEQCTRALRVPSPDLKALEKYTPKTIMAVRGGISFTPVPDYRN